MDSSIDTDFEVSMQKVRSIKCLVTLAAVVSAIAMNAVIAQVASAANLYSEKGLPVTITGAQEGTGVFSVLGGEVKCSTVKFEDELVNSPATAISLTPSYSGCTFAGLASSIAVNGCEFVLDTVAGTTDIACPSGKEITVTAPSVGTAKCVLHIPPQTGVGSASYSNSGLGTTREVVVDQKLSGIKYSQTKGSAETGNCETKDSMTTGSFIGKTRLTGDGEKGHAGIYVAENPEVELELYSEKGLPVTITGAQEGTGVFSVLGGEVKCSTVKFEDELVNTPTTAISLAPSYSGCSFAGLSSSVDVNGCEFVLDTVARTTDIVCPSGKEITVTAPIAGTKKCTVHVPPQTGIGSASYSNSGVGTTREIVVEQNLSGIKYSQTKGSAETGNCETKDSMTTGSFTGKTRLTGEQYLNEGHIGIYVAKKPEVEVELFSEKNPPVIITGAQEGTIYFNTSWGPLGCESAKFVGTLETSQTAEFKLLPSYSKCSIGFYGASITTNGCEFVFKMASYRTDIVCPAGKEITIFVPSVGTPKCIFHIPSQSGIGVLSYGNAGTGSTREVIVKQASSAFRYAQTTGTAEFGRCSTADENTGTFSGSMRLAGEEDNESGGHVGLYVEYAYAE